MAQRTFPGDYQFNATIDTDQQINPPPQPKQTPWWLHALGAVVLVTIVN